MSLIFQKNVNYEMIRQNTVMAFMHHTTILIPIPFMNSDCKMRKKYMTPNWFLVIIRPSSLRPSIPYNIHQVNLKQAHRHAHTHTHTTRSILFLFVNEREVVKLWKEYKSNDNAVILLTDYVL